MLKNDPWFEEGMEAQRAKNHHITAWADSITGQRVWRWLEASRELFTAIRTHIEEILAGPSFLHNWAAKAMKFKK